MKNSSTGTEKYNSLRQQFPDFTYDGFSRKEEQGVLKVQYKFHISGKYFFKPELKFNLQDLPLYDRLSKQELDLFLFNIGMVELISYWKAACPPNVIVKASTLDNWQLEWWKKLYYKGLGEFFYTNGIRPAFDDFMKIQSLPGKNFEPAGRKLSNNMILPIGGGKDSIVSLELMKDFAPQLKPFVINFSPVHMNVLEDSGIHQEDAIKVQRTIDPRLIELNKEGFLNGHTPFSAIVAFIAAFTAYASGCKYIVLSNESSANEPTIPGTGINHQYSKSIEFEADFRNYVSRYIHKDLQYFSMLRPLNELQIGKLFAGFSQYHSSFRSCNAGSKQGIWCGKCPKCLFTYIILSPFLPEQDLQKIFGSNLLDDPELLSIFQQLTGMDPEKPFECVGTTAEVNAAISQVIGRRKKLPYLLQFYAKKTNNQGNDFEKLISAHNPDNFLPPEFDKHLMKWL